MKELTIGFIGLGLIGGSIAKALRRVSPDIRMIAYNRSRESLVAALADGTINEATDQIDSSFAKCDFVILCMPVSANIACLPLLKELLPPSCLITDVGSVKSSIREAARDLDMEDRFLGGHPMTGAERTGYAYSTDRLLENAYYLITPSEATPDEQLKRLEELISMTGAVTTGQRGPGYDCRGACCGWPYRSRCRPTRAAPSRRCSICWSPAACGLPA